MMQLQAVSTASHDAQIGEGLAQRGHSCPSPALRPDVYSAPFRIPGTDLRAGGNRDAWLSAHCVEHLYGGDVHDEFRASVAWRTLRVDTDALPSISLRNGSRGVRRS